MHDEFAVHHNPLQQSVKTDHAADSLDEYARRRWGRFRMGDLLVSETAGRPQLSDSTPLPHRRRTPRAGMEIIEISHFRTGSLAR
jgi:hypothetical protein